MSLVGFSAQNHPQQVGRHGADHGVDDRATDPAVFAELHVRFGFSIDVAATEANAKLTRFFDRRANGLLRSWAGERVWCNPPYSSIRPWIEKAWSEEAALVVMLLPANRTEQAWWQEMVEPFRDRAGSPLAVEFLAGRLRFIHPGKQSIGPNERPPFGCCLLIWREGREIRPSMSQLNLNLSQPT